MPRLCAAESCLRLEHARLDRQFQYDSRSARFQISCRDLAAMLFHDPVADAQAETCTLADGLRRIERIKGSVQVSEAGAAIVKAKHHAIGATCGLNAYVLVGGAFQSVNGVVEQVQKDLFELIFVQRDRRKLRF